VERGQEASPPRFRLAVSNITRRELPAAQTRRSRSFTLGRGVPARFICIFLGFSRVLATNA
jgi:hypothetical protein